MMQISTYRYVHRCDKVIHIHVLLTTHYPVLIIWLRGPSRESFFLQRVLLGSCLRYQRRWLPLTSAWGPTFISWLIPASVTFHHCSTSATSKNVGFPATEGSSRFYIYDEIEPNSLGVVCKWLYPMSLNIKSPIESSCLWWLTCCALARRSQPKVGDEWPCAHRHSSLVLMQVGRSHPICPNNTIFDCMIKKAAHMRIRREVAQTGTPILPSDS